MNEPRHYAKLETLKTYPSSLDVLESLTRQWTVTEAFKKRFKNLKNRFLNQALNIREKIKTTAQKTYYCGISLIKSTLPEVLQTKEQSPQGEKAYALFKQLTNAKIETQREKMRIQYSEHNVLTCYLTANQLIDLVNKTNPKSLQFPTVSEKWYGL